LNNDSDRERYRRNGALEQDGSREEAGETRRGRMSGRGMTGKIENRYLDVNARLLANRAATFRRDENYEIAI